MLPYRQNQRRVKRNFANYRLWEDGIIPYEIDKSKISMYTKENISNKQQDVDVSIVKEKKEYISPMTKAPTLHPQKNLKSNVTTQKRQQKLRLNNDCGPTEDGQLE